MLMKNSFRNSVFLFAALLILPSLAAAQGSARDALSIFPSDTEQFAYANLVQLRAQPNYMEIQTRLLSSQLRNFMDFFRSMGIDPDKDVDEVTLGWHGDLADATAYYGLAWGQFQPERVHDFFVQQKLTWQDYGGYELYAFGSGAARRDIYFVFLSSSAALFGRLGDVKALLDTRAGARPSLNSDADFVKYQAELEGTSPQWGIATGAAAALRAEPWLAGGEKMPFDPKALLAPVKAVLYRMDWGTGVTTHVSVICDSDQSASLLAQLVNAWQTVRLSTPEVGGQGVSEFIRGMQIEASGSRLELTGYAPLQVVGQILNGPEPPQTLQK
jgi:hypothetical protein